MKRRVTISEKALTALKEGIAFRARKIVELEAEVERLNDYVGDSVLPMEIDNGTRIFASAISGGADYVDGMPRQVRIVIRDADGNETERQYIQTDERVDRPKYKRVDRPKQAPKREVVIKHGPHGWHYYVVGEAKGFAGAGSFESYESAAEHAHERGFSVSSDSDFFVGSE